MKPAGLGFEEVTPDDVLLVSESGDVVEGSGRVHLEYPIHTEILKARPDVSAVVHTHAESAVALAATGMELLPIGHEGTLFCCPSIPRYTETGDLIRSPRLGASLAAALGQANAILLVNHGMVSVGPDVPTAVMTAIMLERACRMQLSVGATGADLRYSSAEEVVAKRERVYGPQQISAAWGYLVRQLTDASSGISKYGTADYR
jgi:L-fuculose-phosphate aldolase